MDPMDMLDMTAADFLAEAAGGGVDGLIEAIDSLEERMPEKGADFYEGVSETLKGIASTAARGRSWTDRQELAVENILIGLNQWIDR